MKMFTPPKVFLKKSFECCFEDTLIVGNYFSPFFYVLLDNVAKILVIFEHPFFLRVILRYTAYDITGKMILKQICNT